VQTKILKSERTTDEVFKVLPKACFDNLNQYASRMDLQQRDFATKESSASSVITTESTLSDPRACKQHAKEVDLRSMRNRFHPHQVAELHDYIYISKKKRLSKVGYFLILVKVVKNI
jgi:hypothetical protein